MNLRKSLPHSTKYSIDILVAIPLFYREETKRPLESSSPQGILIHYNSWGIHSYSQFGGKTRKSTINYQFGVGRGRGISVHYAREVTDWASGCPDTEAGTLKLGQAGVQTLKLREGTESLFLRGSCEGGQVGGCWVVNVQLVSSSQSWSQKQMSPAVTRLSQW